MEIKKVSGFGGSGFEHFIVETLSNSPELSQKSSTVLVLTTEERVEGICENIRCYCKLLNVEMEVYPFPLEDERSRIMTLFGVFREPNKKIIVASPQSFYKKTYLKTEFEKSVKKIAVGGEYPNLIDFLVTTGYERVDFVENVGEFSLRGEVVDFWCPFVENPVRIVFNGVVVEQMRFFSRDTQISIDNLSRIDEFTIIPVRELSSGDFYDWLPDDFILFLDAIDQRDCERVCNLSSQIWINEPLIGASCGYASVDFYGGNFKLFLHDMQKILEHQKVVFYRTQGDLKRFKELTESSKISFKFYEGFITEGFINHLKKLFVISTHQFFLKTRTTQLRESLIKRASAPKRLEGVWEISEGDYVVHEDYGIGRYKGVVLLDEPPQEFVEVEYKFHDKLFVPIGDFRKIKKYVGIEGIKPTLSSLDSPHLWKKTKQKASNSAEIFARELLNLYAARENLSAPAMCSETIWEEELEESFPYEETIDQKNAIVDVKKDLERTHPMERLILGDVGFGKTEVALRAAFRAVTNSYQVAIVVPTTILAMQHYERFLERLSSYPVNVVMLHRFLPKSQLKRNIREIKTGIADIVIATHRIFSKDVSFKKLGLLIIDEEHRFGVRQKEKLRHLQKNVHTLYMSATPIPRTLSAALSGIKDISLIETPPVGRKPIETIIEEFSYDRVRSAIYNEISRGGQVFYVHNKIDELVFRLHDFTKEIPFVKWGVIHGRMTSHQIEKVLVEFYERKIDCLLATTIIESGIDIPQVNTIIIDNAENFGLAQLYQLRGRVGRENQKAYCYLFYSSKNLTDDSKKRLEALREFSELGSGYRLARRDLEIRGAGSLFGYRQHGFISAVGLDLYSEMISSAVRKLRGVPVAVKPSIEPTIEISYPVFIPRDYILQDNIRISFYRKFISAESYKEIEDVVAELKDRFGKVPQSVVRVAELAKFRLFLKEKSVRLVKEVEDGFIFQFSPEVCFSSQGICKLIDEMPVQFLPEDKIKVMVYSTGDRILFLRKLLEKILKFATISSVKS